MFPARPPSRRRTLLARSFAVAAGAALGAILASFAAAPGTPSLPATPEVEAIATLIDPACPPQSDPGPEDLRSRWPDDLSYAPVPGWLQFLIGDATGQRFTGAWWPEGATTPRVEEVEARLRADGWRTRRPGPGVVEADKGTLLVEYQTADPADIWLRVDRIPPAWHSWAVLAGALLGAAAAYAVAVRVQRRRDGLMVEVGVAVVMPSFVLLAVTVVAQLSRHPFLDTPLWRDPRHLPLGALLNIAVVLIAVGLWRRFRED